MNPFALILDMLTGWLRRAVTLDARDRAAVRARGEAARAAEAQAAHAERLARMRHAEGLPPGSTLILDRRDIEAALREAKAGPCSPPGGVGDIPSADELACIREVAARRPALGPCIDCGVTGAHAAWCRGTAAKPGEVRCPKCAGRGSFYLGADIVSNSLHSEDCRACGGTGYAAPGDDLPGLARRESERR